MEVGDSFFVPGPRAVRERIKTASAYRRSVFGWRFSIRKEGDGYRCWRIA